MRLLATAELPRVARSHLERLGTLEVSRGALRDEIRTADVVVVRAERLDAETLDAARGLRVVARTGAGVDNVDVAAATARGIPVLHAPESGSGPVAEGTWALILAAAKRLGELRVCITDGRWPERYGVDVLDLRGATLGVVGLGSIGREVARLGIAFGMTVLAADVRPAMDGHDPGVAERTDLEDLVRRSDVITLHCDLNESTRGMVDRDLLRQATRRPVLVNAARGGVVDGDELLLEALDAGWLSAVALDVFASEPLAPDSPLLRDPRAICTPHAIGLTRAWNERVFGGLAQDIRAVTDGRRPRNIVNPDVLAVR